MAGKIFLNYRRGDDPGFTRALYISLESAFSAQRLFMDVEGEIKPGDDFVDVLSRQVKLSDVVLVVIGPRWLETLNNRKSDEDDFVLIEIKSALEQNKRVIPVLVGGAAMPGAPALPESIRALARRNAVAIRPERFSTDVQSLCDALTKITEGAPAAEAEAQTDPRIAGAEAAHPITASARPDPKFTAHFTIQAPTLRRALWKTMFAISPASPNAVMTGFCWAPAPDAKGRPTLHTVATDGHRLAMVETLETAGLSAMTPIIVPRSAAHELYVFLEHAKGGIEVALSPTNIQFSAGARTLSCTPVTGAYPPYLNVIPKSNAYNARLRTNELAAALERMVNAAAPEPARVHFDFTPQGLVLEMPAGMKADIKPVFGAFTQHVLLNAKYVLDILQRLDEDAVDMAFNGPKTPVEWHGVGEIDTTFVVMPLAPPAP